MRPSSLYFSPRCILIYSQESDSLVIWRWTRTHDVSGGSGAFSHCAIRGSFSGSIRTLLGKLVPCLSGIMAARCRLKSIPPRVSTCPPLSLAISSRLPIMTIQYSEQLVRVFRSVRHPLISGGRNGFGAKLCNVFSKKFKVETGERQTGRTFTQVRGSWAGKGLPGMDRQHADDRRADDLGRRDGGFHPDHVSTRPGQVRTGRADGRRGSTVSEEDSRRGGYCARGSRLFRRAEDRGGRLPGLRLPVHR